MASIFKNTWQSALEIERELLKGLAEKEPTFAGISHYILEFRTACQNAILQDFEAARSIDVEGRLWDAHLKINTRFRKLLSRFREDNGKKKKPVEKRKLEKHYLEFVKSSQRFYRGYIQQLASQFGGIPELEKVARKFNFDNLSAEPTIQPSEPIRKRILQSCHATLIRLGDLSRYRETELVSKDRNWGPAIGYYDLATAIYPSSGASHNQLAVIALADGNHLRATYHLYRALSAQEPHPTAKGNLEIEFRKIMNLWVKRELIRPEDAGIPGRALAPWFVYLHAQCYKGVDFPEHDELESEVLNQLAVDLKERSLDGTLQKFCLINIAAEDFSRTRSSEEPVSNASLFFQRINVKTFFTLLQILLAEVERFAVEDSNNKDTKVGADKVTVVARRILPALRNYSSWLLTVNNLLMAYKEEKDTPLAVQVTEFWKVYANALTLLASTFDVVHLPEVDYLLEEDEETLCFSPFSKGATSRRYLDTNGQQKPRMNDPGVERNHPNIEMLYRIREFVIDGLDLVVGNKIPIALVDDEDKKTFIYKEDGLPSQFFASPPGHRHTLSSASIEREDIQQVKQNANCPTDTRSVFGGSQSASASISASMHRIVEGVERLVESDTYENAPAVPEPLSFSPSTHPQLQRPASDQFYGLGTESILRTDSFPVRQTPIAPPGLGPPMANTSAALARVSSSQSYTPRPALPGIPSIWNTAFSPDVGDASSPRTPPGLRPHRVPAPMIPETATSPSHQHISPDSAMNDLVLRQSLIAQAQAQLQQGSSIPPWLSPPGAAMHHQRLSSSPWERDSLDATTATPQQLHPGASFGLPSQPMSSGLSNASWANDAFLASTLSSGAGYPRSGLGNTRQPPSTQYGAIGQSPPCGHGG
ncbi:hypothetical protein P175DRAFT_047883 [Aspergillus ochraceoroseus IBT 24754]|uniref:Nonsense-mediated mRNA decay factor n=3 Tax=Aspergillus subgen. Nidulantes TaxID=2720870 RepID=A0A0F8XCD5_9EURO|nr:uncharacterized protein P175DRAFT_047883 [Aspergillus ochraceoroseus IBT 24754]KKK13414.1 hypothetical protein AOCH_002091 [Aspergillus ochraceoroseus]KKK27170.1 hypothetical protein ARAM_002819 [Aspergillus rambellii]PTU24724.1 hypothetical protein P175DRAFT_047883 [Aspergillus ochraceoroseus IBT 24754]